MVQTKTIPPISQRSRILWKVLLNLYFLFSLDGNLYSSNEIYRYKTALERQSSLSKFGTEFGTCTLRRTRVISLLSLATIGITNITLLGKIISFLILFLVRTIPFARLFDCCYNVKS